MASRVGSIINLVQELSALDPKRERPTVRQLLIFLKIRKTPLISATIAELKELSFQLAANPKYKIVSLVISKEREILTLFPDLTAEEAKILEKYLRSLDSRQQDSLAGFLAKALNAEIQDRHNPDNFSESNMKVFTINMALRNVDYQEDFQLKIKTSVPNSTIFDLVIGFYVNKGYQLMNRMGNGYHNLALMFEKEKEILFVNISPDNPIIQVTVNINN